jgi:hypothetical protein
METGTIRYRHAGKIDQVILERALSAKRGRHQRLFWAGEGIVINIRDGLNHRAGCLIIGSVIDKPIGILGPRRAAVGIEINC